MKAHIIMEKVDQVKCEKCKKTRKLSLPATIADYVLQMQAFGKSHEYC